MFLIGLTVLIIAFMFWFMAFSTFSRMPIVRGTVRWLFYLIIGCMLFGATLMIIGALYMDKPVKVQIEPGTRFRR